MPHEYVAIIAIIVLTAAVFFFALFPVTRPKIRSRAERKAIREPQPLLSSNGDSVKRRNRGLFRRGKTRKPRPVPPARNGHGSR